MATTAKATPAASAAIDIEAPAEQVYALVSDPAALAEVAGEYSGHRWLGGATEAVIGARFIGRNRSGFHRWMTIATISDADPGRRFGFEVTFGPLRVSRWQYDITPTDRGCHVTESTWDRRGWFLRTTAGLLTGTGDRAGRNLENIEITLRNLKERAEQR